ncbi:MarR family winged helix-turn-helix transcriptional regulator [Streptomyces sp. NPDC020731]|uniref:MarR family winged helix-turn-helix transcriptional regulator n=1 Tax=Streptomyces sp. NPDC020731 TaxID=3365085 RepID=UPI0037A3ED8E
MPRDEPSGGAGDDVEAVTRAVLTASRLLVAVSARSLAVVEDRVTPPQFRMPVAFSTRGATKLVTLADLLHVAPSTAMRMAGRLIAAGLADRRTNPANRRETLLRLTDEGRRTIEGVTARRRAEIAAIVGRPAPRQRAAPVGALTALNEAGGEPPRRRTAVVPARVGDGRRTVTGAAQICMLGSHLKGDRGRPTRPRTRDGDIS